MENLSSRRKTGFVDVSDDDDCVVLNGGPLSRLITEIISSDEEEEEEEGSYTASTEAFAAYLDDLVKLGVLDDILKTLFNWRPGDSKLVLDTAGMDALLVYLNGIMTNEMLDDIKSSGVLDDILKRARDRDPDDDDEVVVTLACMDAIFSYVNELVKRGVLDDIRKASFKRRPGDSKPDEEEDDCVILNGDPGKKRVMVVMNDKMDNDDDDLKIIGEKGEVACRDFPHARHLCAKFAFASTPHVVHCTQCHCYVCDSRAPCSHWGRGVSSSDHCHATDKEDRWKSARKRMQKSGNTAQDQLTNDPPSEVFLYIRGRSKIVMACIAA